MILMLLFMFIPALWPYLKSYQIDGLEWRVTIPLLAFLPPLIYVFYTNERIFNFLKPRGNFLIRCCIYLFSLALGGFILWSWVEFQSNPEIELIQDRIDSLIKISMFIVGIVFVAKSLADGIRLFDNFTSDELQERDILHWPKPKKFIDNSEYINREEKIYQMKMNKGVSRISELVQTDMNHRGLLSLSYQEIDDSVKKHALEIHNILSDQYEWPSSSTELFKQYFTKNFSRKYYENIIIHILDRVFHADHHVVNSNELMRLIYLLSDCKEFSKYQTNPESGLMGFLINNTSATIDSNLNFDDKLRLMCLLISTAWNSEIYKNKLQFSLIRWLAKDLEEILRRLESELRLNGARLSYSELFISPKIPPREIDFGFVKERELMLLTEDYFLKLFNRTSFMHQERDKNNKKEFEHIEKNLVELIDSYVIRGD